MSRAAQQAYTLPRAVKAVILKEGRLPDSVKHRIADFTETAIQGMGTKYMVSEQTYQSVIDGKELFDDVAIDAWVTSLELNHPKLVVGVSTLLTTLIDVCDTDSLQLAGWTDAVGKRLEPGVPQLLVYPHHKRGGVGHWAGFTCLLERSADGKVLAKNVHGWDSLGTLNHRDFASFRRALYEVLGVVNASDVCIVQVSAPFQNDSINCGPLLCRMFSYAVHNWRSLFSSRSYTMIAREMKQQIQQARDMLQAILKPSLERTRAHHRKGLPSFTNTYAGWMDAGCIDRPVLLEEGCKHTPPLPIQQRRGVLAAPAMLRSADQCHADAVAQQQKIWDDVKARTTSQRQHPQHKAAQRPVPSVQSAASSDAERPGSSKSNMAAAASSPKVPSASKQQGGSRGLAPVLTPSRSTVPLQQPDQCHADVVVQQQKIWDDVKARTTPQRQHPQHRAAPHPVPSVQSAASSDAERPGSSKSNMAAASSPKVPSASKQQGGSRGLAPVLTPSRSTVPLQRPVIVATEVAPAKVWNRLSPFSVKQQQKVDEPAESNDSSDDFSAGDPDAAFHQQPLAHCWVPATKPMPVLFPRHNGHSHHLSQPPLQGMKPRPTATPTMEKADKQASKDERCPRPEDIFLDGGNRDDSALHLEQPPISEVLRDPDGKITEFMQRMHGYYTYLKDGTYPSEYARLPKKAQRKNQKKMLRLAVKNYK
jgi:hypothetical protein